MTNDRPNLEAVDASLKQLDERRKVLLEIRASLLTAAQKWRDLFADELDATVEPKAAPTVDAAPANKGPESFSKGAKAATKKALILSALSPPRSLWQTANEVQAFLSEKLGRVYPMSSVSPALSDLKKDGTLVRKDMLVALAVRVEKEEPWFFGENGTPEGVPETGGSAATSPPQQPATAQEGEVMHDAERPHHNTAGLAV